MKLYVDNNLVSTRAKPHGLRKISAALLIGGNAIYFKGMIDDIRIYKRTLNSSEIANLYREHDVDLPTIGLVAYYPFNGNANDESGNGNHGTVQNASLTTDRFSNPNSAYYFDAKESTRIFADIKDRYKSLSVSIWVYQEFAITYWPRILEFGTLPIIASAGNHPVFLKEGRKGEIYSRPDFIESCQQTPGYGKWIHIVVIHDHDRGFHKMYIDGKLAKRRSTLDHLNPVSSIISFGNGRHVNNNQLGFKGKIDDIRIYDRALESSEVAALYHEFTLELTGHGLIAYYPFNGNANDESGNSRDGYVTGATLAVDRFGNANSAYAFDGVDDFIYANGLPTLDTFTISLWANIAQTTLGGERIIDYGGRRGQFMMNDGAKTVMVWYAGDQYTNTYLMKLDTWCNLVLVLEGNEISFYADAVLIDRKTIRTGALPEASLYIGSENCIQYYFPGLIDDIRIYDRPLNSREITELYYEFSVALPTNSLVAHYPFNGNANDESGNKYNGKVHGPVPTTDRFGAANSAYLFDGKDDYMDMGDPVGGEFDFDLTQSFSLVAWVKLSSAPEQTIFFKRRMIRGTHLEGYLLRLTDNGIVNFEIEDTRGSISYCLSSTSIDDNQWHLIVAIRDVANDEMRIYIDGVQDGAPIVDNSSTTLANTASFLIGKNSYYGLSPKGLVDDIKVYNRALNDAEIQSMYEPTSVDLNALVKYKSDKRIIEWKIKGKFEKTKDYKKRTGTKNATQKYEEITYEVIQELAIKYIDWRNIIWDYDADQEAYTVTFSDFDKINIPVRVRFAKRIDPHISSFKYKNPVFKLTNGRFMIKSLLIKPPGWRRIVYRSDT